MDILSHKNLTCNVDFNELPEWFQNASTEDAKISYENGLLTWYSGTWRDGTWHSGTWHYGIWRFGIWHSGTWHDGIWRGGIWYSGTWHDGIWHSGVWRGGVWHSGVWRDGVWRDGDWHDGDWRGGVWKDGYKNVGFCKWKVFYSKDKIKIGCYEKTVKDWDLWFAASKVYETPRDTKEFQLIYESYLLAKFAIENKL